MTEADSTAADLGMPRLTSLAAGGGCACKLDLATLDHVLAGVADDVPAPRAAADGARDAGLAVGIGDDAAVWRSGDRWWALTVDVFTPLVDDATTWGRIAAVNAASDVWAMGGRPLVGLAIAGWPAALPTSGLRDVLAGGAAAAAEGGWVVAGGHTITSAEPLYGQAVLGELHRPPVAMSGARPGDAVVLTKAIGTAIVLHAAQQAPPAAQQPGGHLHDAVAAAVASMTTTNARAAEVLVASDVHAMTDVTGFGLLGHAHRLARASGVTMVLDPAGVPVLPGTRELLAAGHVTGGTRRNAAHARDVAGVTGDDADVLLLADAQTSGGLLAALPSAAAADVVTQLRAAGLEAAVVGSVEPPSGASVLLAHDDRGQRAQP